MSRRGHRRGSIAQGKQDILEARALGVPRDNFWVVLHATQVNGPQVQVPKAVAARILPPSRPSEGPGREDPSGARPRDRGNPSSRGRGEERVVLEELASRLERGIAFLPSGPGLLRVAAVADPWVGARRERTPLAVAAPTRKLVFSLPTRVRQYLGVREGDLVAWVVPAEQWEADAPRRGGTARGRAEPGRGGSGTSSGRKRAPRGPVYLVRSEFALERPT